jgi:hypothetical protein
MSEEKELPEDEETEFEIELEPDPSLLGEYISASYFALSAVDDIDVELVNDQIKREIKRIKRKSIRIIDYSIGELYDFIFDESQDD